MNSPRWHRVAHSTSNVKFRCASPIGEASSNRRERGRSQGYASFCLARSNRSKPCVQGAHIEPGQAVVMLCVMEAELKRVVHHLPVRWRQLAQFRRDERWLAHEALPQCRRWWLAGSVACRENYPKKGANNFALPDLQKIVTPFASADSKGPSEHSSTAFRISE